MKTISHIDIIRLENELVKHDVLKVLQWDELQYGNFQAAMGEAYLEQELEAPKEICMELMKAKEFWSWWINHWTQRDITWLRHNPRHQGPVTIAAYKLHHNPRAIMFKPHNTILRYSYAEMMGKVIDTVHHA